MLHCPVLVADDGNLRYGRIFLRLLYFNFLFAHIKLCLHKLVEQNELHINFIKFV